MGKSIKSDQSSKTPYWITRFMRCWRDRVNAMKPDLTAVGSIFVADIEVMRDPFVQ